MIEIFQTGGSVMWVLLVVSILSLAIILERLIFFSQLKLKRKSFIEALRNILTTTPSTQTLSQAQSYCNGVGGRNPLVPVAQCLLLNFARDRESIEKLARLECQKQIATLERRLPTLNTLGSISPLLGLLGTVLGMIQSFIVLSTGNFESAALAGGISQALLTTSFGLIIAIPCIFFYNFFISLVNKAIIELEAGATELLTCLKG